MLSSVKKYRIHAASLDIRIKYDATLIIVAQANDVADKFFRLDARERRVKICGIADVNRVNPRHSGINDKRVKFFAILSISSDLSVGTGANRSRSIE